MPAKLILPGEIASQIEPRVREIAPDTQIIHAATDGTLDGDASDATVMLRWWISKAAFSRVLEAAPQLRWIHTASAGVDNVLTPVLMERDIVLTNSAGAHAIPISEFVLAMMIAQTKRLRELAAFNAHTAWSEGRELALGELSGTTLLIIGLGNIGREVAKRAAAFGMRVVGSRRHPAASEGVTQVVGEDGWRDMLPEADYIAICAPLTPATKGMIDQAAFAQMKPNAYIINIARGQIIETDALLAALHSGSIAGAALDALPEEPLPPEHPLWQAPNVWITPHISWSSPHTNNRAIDYFYENLRRFVANQPLLNVVDKQAGY